jgi:ribonuclease P protein component
MLPKLLRLPYRETTLVRRTGKRTEIPAFFMFVLKRPDLLPPRWFISVPKRIFPLATERNRVRRLFSAAIISSYQKTPAADVFVGVKTGFGTPTLDQVIAWLGQVISLV